MTRHTFMEVGQNDWQCPVCLVRVFSFVMPEYSSDDVLVVQTGRGLPSTMSKRMGMVELDCHTYLIRSVLGS